jgi:hypothetical protein
LEQQSYAAMLRSLGFSAAMMAAACTLVAATSLRPILLRAAGGLLIALVCFELYGFDRDYVILMDSAPWKTLANQARAALPKDEEPYRITGFSVDPPLLPNRFLYARLPSTGGHENFVLERYSLFVERAVGIRPEWQTYLMIPNYTSIYDLLNVRYFFTPTDEPLLRPTDELIQDRVFEFRDRTYALYRNRTALPRALLVHQVEQVESVEAATVALEGVVNGTVQNDSVIEGTPEFPLSSDGAHERGLASAMVSDFGPGHVVIDLDCQAPAVLIYLGNYDPGWKATVDGHPARILPANVWMRAVSIPAGAKRVEMIYAPASFRRGVAIAVCAAILTMTGLLFPMLRPPVGKQLKPEVMRSPARP